MTLEVCKVVPKYPPRGPQKQGQSAKILDSENQRLWDERIDQKTEEVQRELARLRARGARL